MTIGKHLATFNLFREADHSLQITIVGAPGVREELGDSGAPLHLCAMSALYAAVDAARRPPAADAGEVQEGMVERVTVLLGELLFKFDPMCGGTDCDLTARMVAPQLVDALSPQAPSPTFADGVEKKEIEPWNITASNAAASIVSVAAGDWVFAQEAWRRVLGIVPQVKDGPIYEAYEILQKLFDPPSDIDVLAAAIRGLV